MSGNRSIGTAMTSPAVPAVTDQAILGAFGFFEAPTTARGPAWRGSDAQRASSVSVKSGRSLGGYREADQHAEGPEVQDAGAVRGRVAQTDQTAVVLCGELSVGLAGPRLVVDAARRVNLLLLSPVAAEDRFTAPIPEPDASHRQGYLKRAPGGWSPAAYRATLHRMLDIQC